MDKVNIKHSNYTTPEQSKRLLELGLPADSADMCYKINYEVARFDKIPTAIPYKDFTAKILYCPCWSVGELMRIYAICFDPDFIEFDTFANGTSFLQQMLDKFEICIDAMDFSKLEK